MLRQFVFVGLAAVFLVGVVERCHAQFAGVGGVYIDPNGMLRQTSTLADGDLRAKLQSAMAGAKPSQQVSAGSPLRKISLRRLEQAVAALREAGEPLPADIRFLAGLNTIKYVLVYPESGDVVLAGPADAWQQLSSGDIVGRRSNRPVLHLDDLIAALRYAFADHDDGSFMGCSIEPTEPGIKAHEAYIRQLARMNGSQIPQIVQGMEQAMGPQDILIFGVAPGSRFALQMVAADYRLKRLALAHDPSPSKKVPSYLDLAEKAVTGGPQRQHRWWFVGHYDAIRHTADRLAFEFEGCGLRVDTAPTQPGSGSGRNAPKPTAIPKATKAAKLFAELATKNLPELAEKIPVFAELENLVGLAVAATLIRQQADAPHDAGAVDAASDNSPAIAPDRRWRPAHFLDAKVCPIDTFESPRNTPSLANVRFVKDQFWMFSVSGGVEINPESLVADEHLKLAEGAKLNETRMRACRRAGRCGAVVVGLTPDFDGLEFMSPSPIHEWYGNVFGSWHSISGCQFVVAVRRLLEANQTNVANRLPGSESPGRSPANSMRITTSADDDLDDAIGVDCQLAKFLSHPTRSRPDRTSPSGTPVLFRPLPGRPPSRSELRWW